jgi:hypothetical protein
MEDSQSSLMMAMFEGILPGIIILLKQRSRNRIRCESVENVGSSNTFCAKQIVNLIIPYSFS